MPHNLNQITHSCTGCSACFSICPKHAITMQADANGFLRPGIDADACIHCGLCEKACPVLHPAATNSPTTAFAAHALDTAVQQQSSSGGLFSLLAGEVVDAGGIVFGAAFKDASHVAHIGVKSREALSRLRGSKYVQSGLGQTFQQAKAALTAGQPVYFSGTPCQIAGLHAYLGQDYDHLIMQDVICHSAPSPRVWQDYLHTLEQQYGGKAVSVSFRDKRNGWEPYCIHITFDNGAEYIRPAANDPYQQGFIKGLYSRPSCYTCPFKGIARSSDITLADFWGVKEILPPAYHQSGTSLVLLHSEKGRDLFDEIGDEIHAMETDALTAIAFNQAAITATVMPQRHSYFAAHYGIMNFTELVDFCCRPSAGEKINAAWHRSIPYRAARKVYRMLASHE